MVKSNGERARRLLIVTGSYAPTMIADMHRARQLAWQLPEYGWNVEILCPGVAYQPPSCNDPDGAGFFAPGVAVHAVPSWLPRLFRLLGVGSIGLRALAPLYFAGRRLLATRRFDLVYFSTAQFPLFLLGPAWRRAFGIPYVLDLHDPIYAGTATAGTSLKHRLSRHFSRHIERRAAAAASGMIVVSLRYLEVMQAFYKQFRPDWLKPGRSAAIPFGVLPRDLDEARHGLERSLAASKTKRIVYVGTGGPIMARSLKMLCRVLAQLRTRNPLLLQNAQVDLYGTASAIAAAASPYLANVAAEAGVQDLVAEYPDRITYRRSLELLLECGGALVLGVDDPGYMPSKLVSYMYCGKPLLACVHRDGPAFAMLRAQPALGHVLWFSDQAEMPVAEAVAVVSRFLEEVASARTIARDAELAPYTAAAMAGRHAQLFDACLA
jgi:hypothetical protein